jgi:NarL family two-component system sensor histidine kinase YdfH
MGGLFTLETYRKFIRITPETDLSHHRQDMRPIRWFILFWMSMVFLWGCAQLFLGNALKLPIGDLNIIITFARNAPLPQPGPAPHLRNYLSALNQTALPWKLTCLALSFALFGLHWLCLSGKVRQPWYWSYFLLQSFCVLAISFIWADPIIALGLYLVLVIEALSMLKQIRQIVFVVANALVFFLITLVWQVTQVTLWMTFESILLLMIFLIGWIILSVQQIRARGQLETAHLQLAAYAMRVEELTLLNERQRLARELHDTLAQDLVGLTLQLERVDLHLEKQRLARARALVQQAMARARATLAEARSAIDDLRATSLGSDDLLQAVQREITRFTEATSIECTADLCALAAVPDSLCEHVLRAITEGLTNAARHSQAQHVWVCAQQQKAMLTIEVRDDGIGFAHTGVESRAGHYGLLGVRERARLCGGQLDMESVVGRGTTLRLCLPLTQREGVA